MPDSALVDERLGDSSHLDLGDGHALAGGRCPRGAGAVIARGETR